MIDSEVINIITLFVHVFIGLGIIYICTVDLGWFHKRSPVILFRFSITFWWLMEVEGLVLYNTPERKLLAGIFFLVGLLSLILLIEPIKKLMR